MLFLLHLQYQLYYPDRSGHWIHLWMIGVPDDNYYMRPHTPIKKIETYIAGDNWGSWMYVYLQCEFYTNTFNKPSMFVFSLLTSKSLSQLSEIVYLTCLISYHAYTDIAPVF